MITILCVGKIKENYLNELIADYQKRISKYHKIEIVEVKDNDNMQIETNNILSKLDTKSYIICNCIDGKKINSIELSSEIDKIFLYNSHITFIIGGSNGLDEKVTSLSNMKLSFSDFTFPHGLFRGILLEQIYRSMKILNKETYHK